MIKKLFIFSIFVLFFLINSASAETGTITVSNISTNTYINAAGVGTASGVMNYSIIYWNTSAFNKVEDFRIRSTISGTTFTYAFNSTPFTIIANGTGGGVFYYDANTSSVYYVFNPGDTFTGSPLRILMDTNITNQINLRCSVGFVVAGGSTPPSTTEPVYINVTDSVTPGNRYARCGAVGEGYTTTTSAAETGTYNVTYYNIGAQTIFVGNVTKGGFVNSSYKWQSSSYTYASESAFNRNPFYYDSAPYADGLYLNVTLPTGDFTRQLVNSSGAIGIVGVGTGGSASGQISYSTSNISVGQMYGVNASISNSNYSAFNVYYIHAYDANNNLITGFPVEFNSQTYSSGKFWMFNKAGVFKANLSYCGNVLGITDVLCTNGITLKTFLDTASVTIPVPTYNYSVTTNALNYQPGGTIKITASNPSTQDTWLTAFGETGIITEIAWNTLIPAGQTIGITKVIPQNMPKGAYTLNLATTNGYAPIVAQATFNITSAGNNTNTLSLLWDENIYLLGRTGTLTSTSNYNASTLTVTSPGGIVKTFLYPSNSTNYTLIDLDEVGLWKARIEDNGNASNYVQANTTVTTGNPTDNETFDSCKSADTYICWDKVEYQQGDAYTVAFKLPIKGIGFNTYFPFIQTINPSNQIIDNRSVNTSYDANSRMYIGSISGSFTPQATLGVYFVRMYASDLTGVSTVRAEAATIVIGKTVAPTPTIDIETGTNNLLVGNFITIILVMIAFAGIGLELGGFMGSLLGFSSGFIVLGVLGIMPIWAIFLFAIIAITAFAVVAGKQFTGGGND